MIDDLTDLALNAVHRTVDASAGGSHYLNTLYKCNCRHRHSIHNYHVSEFYPAFHLYVTIGTNLPRSLAAVFVLYQTNNHQLVKLF